MGKIRLIGLVGHAGAGKDTAAGFMGGKTFSFAEPLKRFAQEVFDFSDEQVWGSSKHRNAPDPRYLRVPGNPTIKKTLFDRDATGHGFSYDEWHLPDCDGYQCRPGCGYPPAEPVYLTPRHALQTLGTEWGRACYPNIWAEFGVRRAVEWLGELTLHPRLAVITDCRFVNEAKAIQAAGGEVWRIVRQGHVLPPEIANHPSETEQDSEEMERLVDVTVDNQGASLEELEKLVQQLVADFLERCDRTPSGAW